jgi:hypothetical protein
LHFRRPCYLHSQHLFGGLKNLPFRLCLS